MSMKVEEIGSITVTFDSHVDEETGTTTGNIELSPTSLSKWRSIQQDQPNNNARVIGQPNVARSVNLAENKTMGNVETAADANTRKRFSLWSFSTKILICLNITVTSIIILALILQIIVIVTQIHQKTPLVLSFSILNGLIALLALHGQYLFSKVQRLRHVLNSIRMEVNRMMEENNNLCRNVNELESQVERLQHVQDNFQNIVTAQGYSVEQVLSLVQENASIIEQQKKLLDDQAKEGIISAILQSDRDGDFVISDREVDLLVLRLKNTSWDSSSSKGQQDINEIQLRKILQSGVKGRRAGSIRTLIQFLLKEKPDAIH